MLASRLLALVTFVSISIGAARAEDVPDDLTPTTTLVVKAKGKGKVSVRGIGWQKVAALDEPLSWPPSASGVEGVLVRVDLGKDDFYETYLELGDGSYVLQVPEVRGGALLQGKTKIPLSRGVPLVSFAKDKRWDFRVAKSPDGMPIYGPRYVGPGMKGTRIEQVILHASLTKTAREGFDAMVKRSLSVHLYIERDGTLIQALDFDECGYHAGERNQRGIGIDLVGELPNLAPRVPQIDLVDQPGWVDEMEDPEAATQAPGDPNAGVTDPTLLLPMGPTTRINGAPVQSYGYSARAMRTLEATLIALWRAYPTLGRQMATDLGVVADPAVPGVLAHWQTEAQRWDPGTGFDVARIARLARLVASLQAL